MYYGYTDNLRRRFEEHNKGLSKFTKGHLPWQLAFYAAFPNKQKAKDFELYIKSGSGKAFTYKRFVNVAFAKDVSEEFGAPNRP